jgi:hypothetical protein
VVVSRGCRAKHGERGSDDQDRCGEAPAHGNRIALPLRVRDSARQRPAARCEVTHSDRKLSPIAGPDGRDRRRGGADQRIGRLPTSDGKDMRKGCVDNTKAREQIAMSARALVLVRRQGLEPRTR